MVKVQAGGFSAPTAVVHTSILWLACGLVLSACGGGGGGGGPGGGIVTPPVPPSPTSIPEALAGRPAVGTAEYQSSTGLSSINVAAAWNRGGDGSGISVAVIDNGVDPSGELSGRVSAQSIDLDRARNAPTGSTSRHGTQVSTVIAANYNDFGTIGVAYRSTILGVRADAADGGFENSRIAEGLDYATSHGARVINLSLSGGPVSPDIQAALQRATDAGVVVVFSAGNGAGSDPENPGASAGDPRFSGLVLAVGSVDSTNAMAASSNRAGTSQSAYLVAPGVGIVTDCRMSGCSTVSGTSFAAPHVAGAVALLLQMFPTLSARDAVSILLTTATDLGDPGPDAVFGRGKLNLTNAVAPVGALVAMASSDRTISLSPALPGTLATPALGDSIATSAGLMTIGEDRYLRPYQINLAQPLALTGRPAMWGDPHSRPLEVETDISLREVLSLHLVQQTDLQEEPGAAFRRHDPSPTSQFLAPGQGHLLVAALNSERFSLTAASGDGSWSAGALKRQPNPFLEMSGSGSLVQADIRFGRWHLAAAGGEAQHTDLARLRWTDGARLTSASLSYEGMASHWQLDLGEIYEPWGPLGSSLDPGSSFALPSRTGFVSLGSRKTFGSVNLSGQISLGQTRAGGPLLELNGISSAWRLSLGNSCARSDCLGWYLDLSQPLRFEQGELSAWLVDRDAEGQVVNSGLSRIHLGPSGRQMDLRAGLGHSFNGLGYLALEAGLTRDPGHIQGSDMVSGLKVSLSNRF